MAVDDPHADLPGATIEPRDRVHKIMSSEESKWTEDHHLVGSTQTVPVLVNSSRGSTECAVTAFYPEDKAERRPALWRSNYKNTAFDFVALDFSQPLEAGAISFSAVVNQAQQRYQKMILSVLVQQVWPLLIGTSIAEEILTQQLRQQTRKASSIPFYYVRENPSSQQVTFTPSQIVNRVKNGCALIYQQYTQDTAVEGGTGGAAAGRRSSRRQSQDAAKETQLPPIQEEDLWKVKPGGRMARRIATFLEQIDYDHPQILDEPDQDILLAKDNPYLLLDIWSIVEWLGKKTARFMSNGEFQEIWPAEIIMTPEDQRLVDTSETELVPLVPGAHELETNAFMKQLYVLGEYQKPSVSDFQKARYGALQSNATTWPRWDEWVAKSMQCRQQQPTSMVSDEHIAQVLQQQELQQEVPNTRSGRRNRQIFYGTHSAMTQKQLMDTILRNLSEPRTIADLLHLAPKESADPLKRIQGALGKLLYKRRQCCRLECTGKEIDAPSMDDAANHVSLESLEAYERFLRQTELQLRKLLLEQWNDTPVVLVAMAADERENSMDTLDDEDYADLSIEYSTDHPYVGKAVYRPSHRYQTEESPSNIACYWYTIQDYCESAPATAEPEQSATERGNIGMAKEPTLADRRRRFRAVPEEGPMILLTEAQVQAGNLAASMETKATQGAMEFHPFSSHIGSRVCMIGQDEMLQGIIAGTNTTNGCYEILVLKDNGDCFWASDGDDHVAWKADNGKTYTMQQFDYDKSSDAYMQCLSILQYLQRTPKAGPFATPVDPIALGIPMYFDVIKQPMDMSTIANKLEEGNYGVIPSSPYRSPTARMLNGAFKSDICLMFDNAMAFNPPGDWIHQAAFSLKRTALKRIENATRSAEDATHTKPRASIYVDDDSDVDAYIYESDGDDEYVGSRGGGDRRGGRKRHRPKSKEDSSVRAIEKVIRDRGGDSLVGAMSIQSDIRLFSLPSNKWKCRLSSDQNPKIYATPAEDEEKEFTDLQNLLAHLEETEEQSSRRALRYSQEQPHASITLPKNIEYFSTENDSVTFQDRVALEKYLQKVHEHFAAEKYETTGLADFPPYLGRVVNSVWEIPSDYIAPAIKFVIRGLVNSRLVSQLEDENYIVNHYYYLDPDVEPFEQLYRRQNTLKKDEGAISEEEVELSEYERLRAERVARNAERLKALGLV